MSIVNCRYIPFLSMWRNLWRRVMTSDNIMATIAAWQQRRTRYYISKISPRLKLWCAGVYSGPSVLDIVQKNFSVLFNSAFCGTAPRPQIDSKGNWLSCTRPPKDCYNQRQVAFFTENFMFLHLLWAKQTPHIYCNITLEVSASEFHESKIESRGRWVESHRRIVCTAGSTEQGVFQVPSKREEKSTKNSTNNTHIVIRLLTNNPPFSECSNYRGDCLYFGKIWLPFSIRRISDSDEVL